jgi:uncharacterized protein YggE
MIRLATVLLVLVATASVYAQTPVTPSAAQTPVVVTTGTATVKLPPDRAWLVLATERRAAQPTEAQQQNAKAMTAVRQKLQAAGVPADAIRTVSLSLHEDVDFVNGKRVPRGYVAVNAIEVRVDDIDRVGGLLDAAVTGGATSVSQIRFDLKNRDEAERRALREAVADARARAEAAAAGANGTLGGVLRIEEQRSVRPPLPVPMMRAQAMDASPETPVSAGEIEIDAAVTLTAALLTR